MSIRKTILRGFLLVAFLLILVGVSGLVPTLSLRGMDLPPGQRAQVVRVVFTVTLLNTVLVAFGVSVSVLMGRGISRKIGLTLGMVNDMAAAVANGDLSRRLNEGHGAEEFDDLASSLNRMVESLEAVDGELRREVKERMTAESNALEAARAKSSFLAHMSHEFRTPLNGILGYTQLLLLDPGLSERNVSVLNSLRMSGESLLELVNDVLDLSRIEANSMSLQPTWFYLSDFLGGIRESYKEQAVHKGLELKLRYQGDLPEDVHGDPVRLRQVLVNLIGNAIKFTSEGSVKIRVGLAEKGIRFQVEDTGPGIAPEDREKVLEPFVQSGPEDARHKGTGLGLPICKRLLDMMGSALEMESEVGVGTTFSFELPQPPRHDRSLVRPRSEIRGYSGPRRRLLFAEASGIVGPVLVPLMRKIGFEIVEANRGGVMLEELKRLDRVDAVFVDVALKEPGGLDCVRMIRGGGVGDRYRALPLFVMNPRDEQEERQDAVDVGASAFLPVPARLADVLELLGHHLGIAWEESGHERAPPSPEASPEDIPCPPREVLEKFLALARTGNVRLLRESVERFRRESSAYTEFCNQLVSFCAGYQINAMTEWLRERIENSGNIA